MEKTLVIIKPDAVERGLIGRIISRLEDKYLRIIGLVLVKKDESWYDLMYPHLKETPDIYEANKKFMLSSPLIGVALVGNDAVRIVRNLIGNLECPGTVRGDFGTIPERFNCIHASDSIEQAEKEIQWFFQQ